MKKTVIFSAVALTRSSLLFGQRAQATNTDDSFFKDFVSRNWNAESGLPGNTITDIMQDSDGYLYFGTYSGLLRFDGDEFILFNRLYNDRYDFISARVTYQDSRKNIWIGSNDEGIICLKNDGDIMKFSVHDGLPNNSIRAICEDRLGNIWVGTASGLACIDSKFQIIKLSGFDKIPNDNRFIVNRLYCDTAGRVWVITRTENGLYCYTDGRFEISNAITSIENPIVTTMTQDSSGAFWFGVAPFYAVKETAGSEVVYVVGNGNQKGTVVNTIFQDSSKNVWFALDNGISVLHEGVVSYCDSGTMLADDSVNDIMEDHEKNIWFALDRGGIQKFSYGKFKTTNMGTTVNAIVQDTFRDVIWIGCDNGLYCYSHNNFIENKITDYCKNTRIRHVGVTEDGALLVSCYEKHAQLKFNLDGTVDEWHKSEGLAGDKVRVALELKNKDLYVGTTTGLSIIKADTDEIININKNDVLENDYIMCLYEDDDGSVWFGTDGGGIYAYKDGEIIKKITKDDGLVGNVIFKIAQNREGEIWVCTGSGVSIISKETGKIFNFDLSNGFGVDGVFQLLIDYTQTVWATSNQGIFNVSLSHMEELMRGERPYIKPTYFTRLDGITSGGVTSTSLSMKDDKGRLWFTLIDGFTLMDPVTNISNNYAPAVKIETITLDNEKQEINSRNKLIINPDVKRVSLKYTGISFVFSEQVQFKTMLEGFEDSYSDWTTERTASFTNLEPGNYTFHVIAKNADGVLSEKEATLLLVKKAYLWQKTWFRLLIVFVVIGFVTLSVLTRLSAYKQKQEEIQELSIEVTSALAQTIDAKDKYTNGHSNRVAKYSRMLARELGADKKIQERIYYAALLHDIGKIGIPNAIINKPDKLTDEEYKIIKAHPVIGSDILKSISSMPEIAIGARNHHERYDGTGYPDGLRGDDIPWIARVICVADAYDAMTSNRSYRRYLTQEKVKAEFIRCRELQFDPQIADVMIRLIDEDVNYSMHE